MNNSPHQIHMDDLSAECRQIADVIGLDALIALVRICGGGHVYLPTMKKLSVEARNRAIRKEFNGCNYRDLARKYGLTVRWVRAIISDGRQKGCECKGPVDTQLQMF